MSETPSKCQSCNRLVITTVLPWSTRKTNCEICVCVCGGEHMYKCVNECVEVRGQLSASFVPRGCPPCFLGQDLSLGPDENRLAGLQALGICLSWRSQGRDYNCAPPFLGFYFIYFFYMSAREKIQVLLVWLNYLLISFVRYLSEVRPLDTGVY